MSEKIAPRFRKTKTEKWAVMAPVADLEKALEDGGSIEVQRRDGNWSTFTVASLGRPFDVEGTMMCYGYGPDDEDGGSDQSSSGQSSEAPTPAPARRDASNRSGSPARRPSTVSQAPPPDPSEPLPEFRGGPEDEWTEF